MKVQDRSYREGDKPRTPVILLSVAGRLERDAERPAVGMSKVNLDRILQRMHAARPELIRYEDAYDYPILNAHGGTAFEALTGDTEPPEAEYVAPANLERVKAYVDSRPVMAFGGRAFLTAKRANLTLLMHGLHPSSLNRIPNSEVPADTQTERMTKRYAIAAARMLATLAES